RLRHFHVTGSGSDDLGAPLVPLSLAGFFDAEELFDHYPLLIDAEPTDGEVARPFSACVEDAFESMGQNNLLRDHKTKLIWAFAQALDEGRETPLADVIDETCEKFAASFEVSADASRALNTQLAHFKKALGKSGALLGLGNHTLVALYRVALVRERRGRLAEFVSEAASLAESLANILRVDDAHASASGEPGSAAAALGTAGSQFFNADAFATTARSSSGSKALSAERRERISEIVELLRGWVEGGPSATDLVLVHSGTPKTSFEAEGAKVVVDDDILGTATKLYDTEMDLVVEIIRAMRIGRMEVRGEYDAELHESQLSRLDRHGLSSDELLVGTPVVALENRDRLRGMSLAPFSAMLRSGRAIHVLVADGENAPAEGSFSEYAFELGYLVLAHREAFVLQSSLASPEHLISGLGKLAAAVRPAVAVVAQPSGVLPAWLELVSGVAGRGAPLFRYDPGAGPSWAHRLDMGANPQPERPWPVHPITCEGADGKDQTLDLAFTFAHAAALEPSLRGQFWVIPTSAWTDEQINLPELIGAEGDQPSLGLPFIWVVGEDGSLARAVVTRQLTMGTHDHMRSWHTLQELGGLDNEHVRRATKATLDGAHAEAATQLESLEAKHREELEQVRAEAAAEAMGRLVDVLMDLDTAPRSPRSPSAAAAPARTQAPAAQATAPEAADQDDRDDQDDDDDDDVSFDEPWIDSPLCTTCNECTNINPRLFKYNGDSQAIIADLSAGTFAEMVGAAVKCPALCIHPGAPQSGDTTATAELIAQAAPFN
ncbi:MAG: hypothetical protein JRH11_20570, partial [Deltaproteobacteria bacterium]|nr:hypothetical protein [Deltaproteobacteria bacterium]